MSFVSLPLCYCLSLARSRSGSGAICSCPEELVAPCLPDSLLWAMGPHRRWSVRPDAGIEPAIMSYQLSHFLVFSPYGPWAPIGDGAGARKI